jgi:hypothetical protein
MKERCPQFIFAKLPIQVWTQETEEQETKTQGRQGCSAPSVIDLRFTIVVKRFTVNGKFSQAATRFAEDPATFFGGKWPDENTPIRSNPVHRSEWQVKPLSDYGEIFSDFEFLCL